MVKIFIGIIARVVSVMNLTFDIISIPTGIEIACLVKGMKRAVTITSVP